MESQPSNQDKPSEVNKGRRSRLEILRGRLDQQVGRYLQDVYIGKIEEYKSSSPREDQKEQVEILERFIREDINFKVLQDLFREIMRKSDILSQDVEGVVGRITPESIHFKDIDSGGQHTVTTSSGVIINNEINLAIDHHTIDNIVNKEDLLHTVIHEFLHFISHKMESTGLMKIEDDPNPDHFEGVNEGMTELLTDCVLSEYLRRTGDMKKHSTAELFTLSPRYLFQRDIMLGIIEDFSEETGLDKNIIFKAMVEAYCNNRSLFSSEIFNEIENQEIRAVISLSSEVDDFTFEDGKLERLQKQAKSYLEKIKYNIFKYKGIDSRYVIESLFGEDYLSGKNNIGF